MKANVGRQARNCPRRVRAFPFALTENEGNAQGSEFFINPLSSNIECGLHGGEGGIRTLDTLFTYTHFPGVLFQPLRHLSTEILRLSHSLTPKRGEGYNKTL